MLAATLTALADLPAPRAELKRAENRWADYIDEPTARAALAGEYLCHTDFNPENVLVTNGRTVLADWAWATHGAPWIDPALGAIWLIATGGQTPAEAEAWAARMPAWHTAPADTLAVFATANARLWNEIAEDNPGSWSASLRDAAEQWAAFRNRA
jgi:Ser/Thr protein kinase RdoA (MazF antagonist)